jgi:hypothetical protein
MPIPPYFDQTISFKDAGVMTANYRAQNPGAVIAGFFFAQAITSLLNQPGCVGIRYYYAIANDGSEQLVLAGVDANGNDLVGQNNVCIDMSCPCPPFCSTNNILNS